MKNPKALSRDSHISSILEVSKINHIEDIIAKMLKTSVIYSFFRFFNRIKTISIIAITSCKVFLQL